MKRIVYYHKHCLDGFGSAWAAWKKFGDAAEYVGLLREYPPVDGTGTEMYFIDFTYPLPIMEKLKSQGNRLIALDHHISQEAATKICDDFVYDLNRSGAVIAWQYFHPGTPVPKLLSYIQDNDLFTNRLPYIRECISALALEEQTFENFSRLARLCEDDHEFHALVQRGQILLQAREGAVAKLLARAEPITFEGYDTMIVNTFIHYSDVAAAIYREKGCPLGMAWSYADGKIHVSLRSDGVTVDCSAIAQKYGGGGHKGAAGFILDFHAEFPWTTRVAQTSYDAKPISASSTQ